MSELEVEDAEERSILDGSLANKLVGGVLFGILVYSGIVFWLGADQFSAALEDFPLWLIPAACGLSFANYALRFLKWERYRSLLGIELDRRTSWLIYLAGFSMGVTPGKMGEVLKSWLIRRVTGTPIHRSAPIVVAERFTDLVGYLLLVAIGGIATVPEYQWIFWATLALCLVGLALAGSQRFAKLSTRALAKTPFLWRLAGRVEGSFESVRLLLSPREIVFPTLLSTVSWGLECAGFWLLANGVADQPVSFLFCVFAYAFSAVAGAILIIFPGGLGITEGLLGTLLRRELQPGIDPNLPTEVAVEVARGQAASATILARLCTLWFGVLVGLIALAIFKRRFGARPSDDESDRA
ncbi:MAG: lysylphosphatidylglycerol synthase transmembrane domain-containing protein [Planctomycetota bacterium]